MKLAQPAQARYVRVLMQQARLARGLHPQRDGGLRQRRPVAAAETRPSPSATLLELAGGAWRVQRDSLVKADGIALSKPGFDDSAWVPATVPGTVLVSYLNAGAIPDPNFSDNQLMISDSFF